MTIFRKLFNFTRQEIDSTFNTVCKKHYNQGLKLLESPFTSTTLTHGKLLVIIPRTSGKAHDRNKFKRQARAIFYENNLHLKKSSWILLVRKGGLDISYDNLKKFLISSMQK